MKYSFRLGGASPQPLTKVLIGLFVGAMLLPNIALCITESLPFRLCAPSLLIPLGGWLLVSVAVARSGVMPLLAVPFAVLGAFQLVLLYLFGGAVISTDMFTNLLTTNPGEAGELLISIVPALILVGAVYLPLWGLAVREIVQGRSIAPRQRHRMALLGCLSLVAGLLLLPRGEALSTMRRCVFPLNVLQNLGQALEERRQMADFEYTSAGFRYDAVRTSTPPEREIYLYVIGEASRAMSWQLFGYERETNPKLARRSDLCLFDHLQTQSNTTHRSVPLMLSSVPASHQRLLYRRTGLPALLREAGFETWFLSNQQPQGAMIDKLAAAADHCYYLPEGSYDELLVDRAERIIAQSPAQRLVLILHCYGSHYNYRERYPRDFAHFLPDDEVAIHPRHRKPLRNAYDNSIRYTDHLLDRAIRLLAAQPNSCTALLYCADHGEDLFDESPKRFLHSSPILTPYQLHVAALAWFSPTYRQHYPWRVAAARANRSVPATTYSLFHTLAEIASIASPYVDDRASLLSPRFDSLRPRYYLNDHNRAASFRHIGLQEEDYAYFRTRNIGL